MRFTREQLRNQQNKAEWVAVVSGAVCFSCCACCFTKEAQVISLWELLILYFLNEMEVIQFILAFLFSFTHSVWLFENHCLWDQLDGWVDKSTCCPNTATWVLSLEPYDGRRESDPWNLLSDLHVCFFLLGGSGHSFLKKSKGWDLAACTLHGFQ